MNCRHCGRELSLRFLDLGASPPSNAYLDKSALDAMEPWYPLRVSVCDACWLVQTEDFVRGSDVFREDYGYFSSMSASWLEHARHYVRMAITRFGLSPASQVCELAANDGYLLQFVREAGVPCYGVEPTESTARAARAKGIDIVQEFFGTGLADQLVAAGRAADLIAANNVLAHVPDIVDFARGVATLLKREGVATFEFQHLLTLIRDAQFDTIYHEHFSYLSLTATRAVLASAGLTIFDVEHLPTHGGSLRVFAQRTETGTRPVSTSVAAILAQEDAAGLTTRAAYRDFQARAERIKDALLLFLLEAKRAGRRVGAYGAAAKGNTLLNFAGVRPDLMPYVVDRSPGKVGRFMPGSRIPIVDEAHLLAHRPDDILILPWNIRDEIIQQLAPAHEWGARFVTAVPELSIV